MVKNKTASQQLDQYLQSFKSRLQKLTLLNGIAKASVIILLVCLLAAWLVSSSGFADTNVLLGRLFIVVAVIASVYFFIIVPRKSVANEATRTAQQRVPAFAGRLATWKESSSQSNPLNELLAEDTLAIAANHPAEESIPSKELTRAGGIIAACALLFVTALSVGPAMTNHSLRHLLAGWMTSDGLLPPQSLLVSPGDSVVRFGSNLMIEVTAKGFDPKDTTIHVKPAGESWQELQMTRSTQENNFEFSLFALREPLNYYITAAGVRSPEFNIEVVELPSISKLELTYNYPDWTELAPETKPGGDIDALPGTVIDLEVITEKELPGGVLVLDDNAQKLKLNGTTGTTQFEVQQAGEYYLAATMGSEQVRLTDNFFIRTTEDNKPKIEFVVPGGDWRASNIEEVTTELKLQDDYGVESVEVRYSINGGDWQSVALSGDKRDATMEHLFYLEDLGPNGELLQAGDLISYYGVATDREQTVQTDIFFVEVQPFDRRYSQSQQAGGAAGRGGQGQNEQEISQKQREIIISTWNLTREQEELVAAGDPEKLARIHDNARLLSGLQNALAEQAASLVDTARSRMLDQDPRIKTFIEHMDAAITAMQPASEELGNLDLVKAIKPEQEALQHLLRADAVFNEIQVGTQQGGGGGQGGGQEAAELAEMFELEIDLQQNQYETGSSASAEAQQQESQQALDDISDLARRQEQLARNMRGQNEISDAQRWQQEMLRREAEELQQRLEQLQRGPESGSQGQTSQSASDSGTQDNGTVANNESANTNLNEISRRLDSAINAMDRASEAIRSGDQQQIEQASGEAQRQLQGAGEKLASEQQQSIQRSFDDMAERAKQLARDQQRIEQQLLEGIQDALAAAPEDAEEIDNPFTLDEELEMAEQKKDMNARLQRLQIDINKNANAIKSDKPTTARKLEQANDAIKEAEITERIDNAISYMSQGASLYVANSESMVTRELDKLSEELQQARDDYTQGGEENSDMQRILSTMEAATNTLQEALERDPTGAQSGSNTQSTEPGGEAGYSESPGNGREIADGRWGGWGQGIREFGDAESQLLDQQLQLAATDAGRLLSELENRGVSEREMASISQLIKELQNSSLRQNNSQADYNDALATLQLLQKNIESGLAGDVEIVRSENPDIIPNNYKEAVAEYYRRLSSDDKAQPTTNE